MKERGPTLQESPAPGAPARPRIFRGWYIVAAGVGVNFAITAVFNPILSIFILPLEQELGWNRASIAAAITVGGLVGAVIGPIAGPYIDRYGARLFVAGGGAAIGLVLIALAWISEVWQFWILFGLGRLSAMSFVSPAAVVTVSNWFIRRRGIAVSILFAGQRLGQGLVPLAAFALIAAYGWRQAWAVIGVGVLIISVVPTLLVMRRRPEDVGLLPDGAWGPAAEQELPGPAGGDWTRSEAIRTKTLWLIILSNSLFFLLGGSLNLHLAPYWQGRGLSGPEAVTALSVFAITAAVASIVWGGVADRLGIRPVLVGCLTGGGVAALYLLTTTTLTQALIFAVIYGASFGGGFTLSQVIIADYFGRTHLGSIRGFLVPFILPVNAFGPLAAGLYFDATGTYIPLFAVLAILCLVGAAAMALAKRPRRRPSDAALPEIEGA